MQHTSMRFLLLSFVTFLGAAEAQAISCMVLGDKAAKVFTPAGERSPMFMATECQALRLVSGKAMASWVGKDGKPHFVPITPRGVETLPSPGAEERPANVVWGELTSRRAAPRGAYMRTIGEERPARVFVPAEGLSLGHLLTEGATVRLVQMRGGKEVASTEHRAVDGAPLVLGRDLVRPGESYEVHIHSGGKTDKLKWAVLGAEESQHVQAQLDEVKATVPDAEQQRLLQAMVFEQLRLRLNMDLMIQGLR